VLAADINRDVVDDFLMEGGGADGTSGQLILLGGCFAVLNEKESIALLGRKVFRGSFVIGL
jgi:hypothetical protein